MSALEMSRAQSTEQVLQLILRQRVVILIVRTVFSTHHSSEAKQHITKKTKYRSKSARVRS